MKHLSERLVGIDLYCVSLEVVPKLPRSENEGIGKLFQVWITHLEAIENFTDKVDR